MPAAMHAERVVAGEQCDDDGCIPVLRREAVRQLIVYPEHLQAPGETGEHTGYAQRQHCVQRHPHARIARCARVEADRPHLESECRLLQQQPDDHRRSDGDHDAPRQLCLGEHLGEWQRRDLGVRRDHGGLWDVPWLPHRSVWFFNHVFDQKNPDVAHHHGRDDLVCAEQRLGQSGDDAAPQAARDHARRKGEQAVQPAGKSREVIPDPDRRHRADPVLPVGADVEQSGAK